MLEGGQKAALELAQVQKGVYGVASAADAAARSTRRLAEEQKRLHQVARGGAGAGGAPHVGRYFQALGKMGGPMGSTMSRVGGAIGMEGIGPGLGALGGAAIAAGLALKAFVAASDHAVAAAMLEAKARTDLRHAVQNSGRAADSSAVGTFKSNEDAIRSMVGMGGDGMLAKAQDFAARTGTEDGFKAYAALAKTGRLGSLGAVTAAQHTGQIDLAKAAELVASGKVSLSGNDNQVAANILNSANPDHPGGYSADSVWKMRGNTAGDAGQRLASYDYLQGRVTSAGVARFMSNQDGITSGQQGEYNRLLDSRGAGKADYMESMSGHLAQLASGSQAEFMMVGLLRDIAYAVGMGEGSMAGQYNRAAAALP